MTNCIHRAARALAILAVLALAGVSCAQSDTPAPASAKAATQHTWGTLDPLTRLLPIDTYKGDLGGTLKMSGGRNEVVDQQLVLFAGPKAWSRITLSFSALTGPAGANLPASLIHWRQIGSVETRKPYYSVRYVGEWPDPLLPPAPFDIAASSRAFAWIDCHLPDTAAPGDYKGNITIKSSDGQSVTAPIEIHIWEFTLPHANHMQTAFGIQGQGKHPLNIDAVRTDMLAHRISPNRSVADPKRVTTDGKTTWDWTAFDNQTEQRLAQGMSSAVAWIDQNNPPAALYQSHLAAKGWLPLFYTYLGDEPTQGQLAALNIKMGDVKKDAPGLRNLITARGFPSALTHADIWCPELYYFDPAQAKQQQDAGHEVWWYPAYSDQHPKINLWTDYPALDDRIWPWMTWKYNLDGMLYWSVSSYSNTTDPLKQAPAFLGGDGAANGDGQLIYPGPGGAPIDSIRFEALRDGLQDYEVFCLLEAGANELDSAHKSPGLVKDARNLLAISPKVMTTYKSYTDNPAALLSARNQMSETLEKIVRALGHDPTITTRPRANPKIAELQEQAYAKESAAR